MPRGGRGMPEERLPRNPEKMGFPEAKLVNSSKSPRRGPREGLEEQVAIWQQGSYQRPLGQKPEDARPGWAGVGGFQGAVNGSSENSGQTGPYLEKVVYFLRIKSSAAQVRGVWGLVARVVPADPERRGAEAGPLCTCPPPCQEHPPPPASLPPLGLRNHGSQTPATSQIQPCCLFLYSL